MTEWWLSFLSNMFAGLVSGAVLGLVSAWGSRRSGRHGPQSASRRSDHEPPLLVVDARSQSFEQQIFTFEAPTPRHQSRRTGEVSRGREEFDPWVVIVGGLIACLATAWGYLRYQETVLLVVVFVSAFLSAFVVAAIVYAMRSGVRFQPTIAVESVAFVIALGALLASLYFPNVARFTPQQQALTDLAEGSLADFAGSSSPEDWFSIVYQLIGLLAAVLLVLMIVGSGIGLLALIRGVRLASDGRRPRAILARLAGLRYRGYAFVFLAIFMSTLSILLSSGLVFGWISNSWTYP